MAVALLGERGATGLYDGCAAGWESWCAARWERSYWALRRLRFDVWLESCCAARWDRAALLGERGGRRLMRC